MASVEFERNDTDSENDDAPPGRSRKSKRGRGPSLHLIKSKIGKCEGMEGFGLPYVEHDAQYDDKFKPADSFEECHTTPELLGFAAQDDKIEIDARILMREQRTMRSIPKLRIARMNREALLNACRSNDQRFREGGDGSGFCDDSTGNSPYVGSESVPLIGGPFSKQLYYADYIRMHAMCFYAAHHDPTAKRILATLRDFVIGRGLNIEVKHDDAGTEGKAETIVKRWEEQNNSEQLWDDIMRELPTYGEIMPWWLPGNAKFVSYPKKSSTPTGNMPTLRLQDPSSCWEVVTWPEDIQNVLYYQMVYPTQYQMFTGRDDKTGETVSSSKFIIQQIQASEMMHFKINAFSNEKRGRSELFPILGYLKRLRDSVDYSIIGMQKAAAWGIDTTIDGNQTDIDSYAASQKALGTIPQAGSEFIHSKKVSRVYLGNQHASTGKSSEAFDWCLSMIAIGCGIPISYLGTHISTGSTKASAVVGTEPVAKKFEFFQLQLDRIIRRIITRLLHLNGIHGAKVQTTFPEIITQDRSQKLKDLGFAQTMGWITKERVATAAAKEFDLRDYDYEEEQDDIADEKQQAIDDMPEEPAPLSNSATPTFQDDEPKPGQGGTPPPTTKPDPTQKPGGKVKPSSSAVTSKDKRDTNQRRG